MIDLAQVEITKALQVALLLDEGLSRTEIEQATGQSQADIRSSIKRLQQIAERIDRDSEF